MSLKSKIQSLITAANAATGETDTTLTDAVSTLIDGYGAGATEPYVEETYDASGNLIGVVLHGNYTAIRKGAFYNSDKLKSVQMPQSVTLIRADAFNGCSALQTLAIPNGVTTFDNRAFSGCRNMTTINLPDSLVNINGYALQSCRSLPADLHIPMHVEKIDAHAFEGCVSLRNVYIDGSTSINIDIPNIGPFYNLNALETIQVGALGRPASHNFRLGTKFLNCPSTLTVTIYVDTSTIAETEAQYLGVSDAPWGNSNATIVLRNSTTGEVITE